MLTAFREIAMKETDQKGVVEDSLKKLSQGVFLTVKSGNALNTMTIGWATFGVVWNKPILMVAVRSSRHTFGIIEKAEDFTVTIPSGDLRREIAFCGTKSGRDVDKFEACSLKTAPARRIASPVIQTPGRHYECRILYKSAMDPSFLAEECDSAFYPRKDYHTLYFGEILDCYETE